jgi:hypothetical protein
MQNRTLRLHLTAWLATAPQGFLDELANMLSRSGISVPERALPPVVWHNGREFHIAETLQQALEAGERKFGARPDVLLVLLPDKSE